jgi:putative CocE/NonD family hydrolase
MAGAAALLFRIDAAASGEPPALPTTLQYDVPVPMRDGVLLATDVYRPDASGRFPVILMRTPYNKADERDDALFFAARGYAFLVQDVRGRYDSGGAWLPFRHEADDGYDAEEWAAKQPWSNGDVVTYGGSYAAIDQWLAATRHSTHLKAMAPEFSPSDLYDGMFYPGGAFQQAIAQTWGTLVAERVKQSASLANDPWTKVFAHLPVVRALDVIGRRLRFYEEWLEHPSHDSYWKALAWRDSFADVDCPAFLVHSWYDVFNVRHGNLENFERLRATGPKRFRDAHRLVVGPWEHGPHGTKVGEVEFGPKSIIDLQELELRWFDHYVKGIDNGAERDAPVKVFTMGENAWHDYADWPVPGTRRVSYYLRSGGRANTLLGDGGLGETAPGRAERPDRYTYDPKDPVPNAGGGNCCWPKILPWGPLDQRAVERRDDVLVYTTPPLAGDLRVTGAVSAELWVTSSAPDTDFAVKLVDVDPGGFAMNLTDGIARARYRSSAERPELLEPGRATRISVDVGNTSNLFLKGHRLRVEISSANFPRYSRNTNTGRQPEIDTETRPAEQTIWHDAEHASRLVLPVLPARE